MRRHLLALFLFAYLLAFSAPFVASVMADDDTWTDAGLCHLPNLVEAFPLGTTQGSPTDDETYQAWAKQTEEAISGAYTGDTCGEKNGTTGLLEKGDCSKAGKIITEITEPIAPNVTLDENTKVITVYQGQCCLTYYADPSASATSTNPIVCDEVRTIYADTYTTCKDYGVRCQERQWLIAQSGTGLLKLFTKQAYTWGAFAVGTIAVGTIIFQGIKISISGVSGDISDAKSKIIQAISGMVLLFLSSLILYTINPDFFG